MKSMKVQLDWTPNSNHIGMYVAISKNYYADLGLNVELICPSENYSISETPTRNVINGNADLCIAPSESLISCYTRHSVDVTSLPKAIASLLNQDSSAIATKKSIKSLKELDGKIYASYGARFESDIISCNIRNDGGKGTIQVVEPPKLHCFDEVMKENADATWIFPFWEGIIATSKGYEFNTFPLNCNYGYSPIILASHEMITNRGDDLKSFLKATAKGYAYAKSNPEDAAKLLKETANHHSLDDISTDVLEQSIELLSKNFMIKSKVTATGTSTGKEGTDVSEVCMEPMDSQRWSSFISWLFTNDCIKSSTGEIMPSSCFDSGEGVAWTNEFIF